VWTVRLSEEMQESLVEYAKNYFGSNSKLYLFGSRVDDSKKGGDIDLLVETPHPIEPEREISFLRAIYKNITPRKIDLLVKTPYGQDKPIFHTALKEGIRLC